MRKAPVAVVLLLGLSGCSGEAGVPRPPDATVDSAELRETKARIGMADCEPGPGEGPWKAAYRT